MRSSSGPGLLSAAALLVLVTFGTLPTFAAGDRAYEAARNSFEAGDLADAAKWLEEAVAQGHQAAKLPLAAMYRDGHGVIRNYKRAMTLFTSAAEFGYPSAQFSLGSMYRSGQGVERNYVQALKWYRMAASQGDAESQNSLGVMYEAGRGTKKDAIKAYAWYEIASQNGSRRGEHNRRRLSRKLSATELPISEKLSMTCLASNYRNCD